MRDFLEQLQENFIKYADSLALSGGEGRTITYRQLGEGSGRVYHYLKDLGIGQDDYVMISLPRSIDTIVAMIGVMRAGAAFVLFEDGHATDRQEYIYQDCRCRLKLTADVYSKMLACETLEGYEERDEHAQAYACYTSGTTGFPKGAVHEYGVFTHSVEAFGCDGVSFVRESGKECFAFVPPFEFIAGTTLIPAVLYYACTVVVVPMELVKNPPRLKELFAKNKVTMAFLSPSLYRVFHEFNPEFCMLFLGGEIVSEMEPLKGIWTYNVYAQTETGFIVASHWIREKEMVAPIGRAYSDQVGLTVLGEDGKPVRPGEIGEICFNNPYFRGYICQESEKSENLKSSASSFYHASDMGKMTEDGSIVLCGRNDDMVKINGNRVELVEIEKIVRDVLGVDWVGVRYIKNQNSAMLIAYFAEKPKIQVSEAKRILKDKLPSYMQPTNYICVDFIPLSSNGKVCKSKLALPQRKVLAAYAKPMDELQSRIASIMAEVLQLSNVGIDTNFDEIGGDSIAAMEVLNLLDEPELSAEEFYEAKTVRNLASLLRKKKGTLQNHFIEKDNEEAMRQTLPLTSMQKYFLDHQLSTPAAEQSTMFNLPMLARFDASVDMLRVEKALQTVMENHPAFGTILIYTESSDLPSSLTEDGISKEQGNSLDTDGRKRGNVLQYYDSTQIPVVRLERISEKQFARVKEELFYPFEIYGKPLCHVRLIVTEEAGYLYFDMHHMMSDGTSAHLFFTQLYQAYKGENLPPDYYYLYLQDSIRQPARAYYEECKAYCEKTFEGTDWNTKPREDFCEIIKNEMGIHKKKLEIDELKLGVLDMDIGIKQNGIFIAAALLSIAYYNRCEDVMISWAFHGRDNRYKNNMIGALLLDLPVALHVDPSQSTKEIYEHLLVQLKEGMAHSCYPYTLCNEKLVKEGLVCFLYQKDVFHFEKREDFPYELIQLPNHEMMADNVFSLEIEENEKEKTTELVIDYCRDCYQESSVQHYGEIYGAMLEELLTDAGEYKTVAEVMSAVRRQEKTL